MLSRAEHSNMSLLAKWLALKIVNKRPPLPTRYSAPTISEEINTLPIEITVSFEWEEPAPAETYDVIETEAGLVTQGAEDIDPADIEIEDFYAETRIAETLQHRPRSPQTPKDGPTVF